MKKRVVAVLLVLACLLTGCNYKQVSEAETVSFWFGGSMLGNGEPEQAQDSWVITQLIREYEKSHNVKVILNYFEDEEAMVHLIENNCRLSLDVPDVACLYSSEILRNMAYCIKPLKSYISDDERDNIMNWETVTDNGEDFENSEEVLGYPINGIEVTFMAYNKSIMNACGVDIERNPPTSFDELYALCETIAAHNITPIIAGDNGWNQLYVQLFAKRWLQFSGEQSIIAMGKGLRNFSDDENLIASLNMANAYYSAGFINKDYATTNDSDTQFANGNGAMYVCSNFEVTSFKEIMGDDFGIFLIPDFSDQVCLIPHLSFGGSNQCLSTFIDSKHSAEAIDIIKWLSTRNSSIFFASNDGGFPNRRDISLEDYTEEPDNIQKQIFSLTEYAHCTPDYFLPLNVYADFSKYSLEVMTGELSLDAFLEYLDSSV